MTDSLVPQSYRAPIDDIGRVGPRLFWEIFRAALEHKLYEWTCAQVGEPVDPGRQAVYQAMIRLLRRTGEPKSRQEGSWEDELQDLFDNTHACRRACERWLVDNDMPVS